MVKSLALTAVILGCGLSVQSISGQSASNYADTVANPRAVEQRVVSPEARAEAKRLYKEGVKYGVAGFYPQAIEILQRAVKLDPQSSDAHYALGHAYFDSQQWKDAVRSFERVVELIPRDQDARDRLALARTMAHGGSQSVVVRSEPAPDSPAAVQVSLEANPKQVEPAESETVPSEAPKEEDGAATKEIDLTRIYRVGPGDVLDIRVNDSSSPQSTLFTVTPSGFMDHPLLGEPIQAGGLTVDEISAKFESELKRRALVDNPRVLIGVRDYASHTILVSGLVKDSGTKILRREAIPLYVVVADAQPLPEAARVTVVRNQSGETFEIDLTQAAEMNLLVRSGDVITLQPNLTQFMYVGGEVKLPGEKTYRRSMTLTQAMIAAGGATPKAKEARIGRDDGKGFLVVTRYKLKDIESGKVADPVIKPGDRITIRE